MQSKYTDSEIAIRNKLFIANQFNIDRMSQQLTARVNDLRHLMNDQLIYLKYGGNYQASYNDPIIIQAEWKSHAN